MEISLLDNEKRWLESYREAFLRAAERPIEFHATQLGSLEESTYYIVCEYQGILSRGPQQTWYQTWLPFKPFKSGEKGKIYVELGELEFKEISEKDRIDGFISRSKPK